MTWNWELTKWPSLRYDSAALQSQETSFLQHAGVLQGALKYVDEVSKKQFAIEIIGNEALKTSEIEGEILNRESVQASLRRNFGLVSDPLKIPRAEQNISEMMVSLYKTYDKPLSHKQLFEWHKMLTSGRRDIHKSGAYRTHAEAMQIVSGPQHKLKIHFVAPPSKNVKHEMDQFIKWFNQTGPKGASPLPALARAAIAHLYFVCIHPFEDGNGRIARALAEKALAQALERPSLIALSVLIQKDRKKYYRQLDNNNKNLEITNWVSYFAEVVLAAQHYSQAMIDFLIKKIQFFESHKDKLNPRQKKAIARMFQEGPDGFTGGLNADKYISITKASRATATRDLKELVDLGVLRRTGELKYTRYYLKMT